LALFCERCVLKPSTSKQTCCPHFEADYEYLQAEINVNDTVQSPLDPPIFNYTTVSDPILHLTDDETVSQLNDDTFSYSEEENSSSFSTDITHVNSQSAPIRKNPKIDENTNQIQESIKIGTLNVCGLKSRVNCPEFVNLIEQYSIFCVAETKLDKYDEINIPNYTFFSKPRAEKFKRKSGGIGFFVHDSILKDISVL